MTKLKQLIEKISSKKNTKILLLIFLVVGFFVGHTFAASTVSGDGSAVDETIKDLSAIFKYLVQVLSWIWIVLANLAGQLMTNHLLYGEFLHLDVTLWTLWNIIKNFSNFALGFILIVTILKGIISKSGSNKVVDIVKKTLISGVLIQMSWFLIGATVDVSTIMTTAVGAFPAQVIAASDEVSLATSNGLKKLLNGNKLKFYANGKVDVVPKSQDVSEDDMKSLMDSILPSSDSMAGPLIFIGISAFNFMDMAVIDENKTVDSLSDLILQIGLDGIVLLAYTVMMFFIFLFNLLRILVLWVVIPLSPVMILMYVFKIDSSKLGKDLGSFVKVENVIKLIFKPVLMVGALSLVLLVLVLVKSIINHDKASLLMQDYGTEIETSVANETDKLYDSSMALDGLVNFSANGFKDGLADILVYILGLCLVYFVMKMSVKSGTGIGFVDDKLNKLMDDTGKFLSQLPIIPVGGGKAVGRSVLSDAVQRKPGGYISSMETRQEKILKERMPWLYPDETVGLFADLSVDVSREKFIENAYNIAKTNNLLVSGEPYIKDDSYYSLGTKITKWNDKHKNTTGFQKIDKKEISEYKPKETES